MDPVTSFEVDHPSGNPREPCFFLTHGAGGDLSSNGLRAMSSSLAKLGHLSVRANLPYRMAGRKNPPAAAKSVPGFVEAFHRAKAGFGPNSAWVTGGRSYGGRVASMAASEGLGTLGLLFFPYPLHRPGDSEHPRVGHWSKISCPCLFVQGTKDPFCDLDQMRRLLPTLGGEGALLLVEGGDHSLRVRSQKSPGTPGRSEQDVVTSLLPAITQWLAEI